MMRWLWVYDKSRLKMMGKAKFLYTITSIYGAIAGLFCLSRCEVFHQRYACNVCKVY